jgi:hydroxylaminobenzene mutase
MTNQRMGLSSHLEGVMNGMFLMVVGLGWSRLALSPRALSVAYWCLLYGSFANWFFVQLSAVWGTSEMTPIAGAGHVGSAWQESVVTAGLVSVGISMLIAGVLLVIGFFRGPSD